MALKPGLFDDLLHFASTSRSRSTVTLAAVSFAVCHLIIMATGPSPASGSADEIPRQLIHFFAELCRFALPLSVMAIGLIQGLSKRSTL
jgi:hypothetical protein